MATSGLSKALAAYNAAISAAKKRGVKNPQTDPSVKKARQAYYAAKNPKSSSSSSSSSSSNSAYDSAKKSVNLSLNPQLNEITRQRNELAQQAVDEQKKLESHGNRVSSDIKTLYSSLDKNFDTKNAAVDNAYKAAAQNVAGNFEKGSEAQQVAFANQNDASTKELERLGLELPANARAQADQAFFQKMQEFNRINAANMLATQQANANATGTQIAENEQARGAKSNADFQSLTQQAIADSIKNQGIKDYSLSQKYTDIESQRGALMEQALQQMEIQAYERQAEQQQQSFMNALALSKFNLSADTAQQNAAYRAAQLKLEQARLLASQQADANKLAASKGPTLNPTAAYTYLGGTLPGVNADAKAALLSAFRDASTAKEINFNDPKSFNGSVDWMRNFLANRYPQFNTGENMAYLSDALRKYLGLIA